MADRRILLVLTVKNEGPSILEWVAHHRLVGFTDIAIYHNDCTDLTDRILAQLARMGVVQTFENRLQPSFRRPPYQNRAYRLASGLPVYAECDWCMALDSDEYLALPDGVAGVGGLIDAVEARAGTVEEIRVNWRIFGSSWHETLTDALVTAPFTDAEPAALAAQMPVGYKTLFRTRAFARPGIHRPKEPRIEASRVANASGLRPDAFDQIGWRATDPGHYRFGAIHHYQLRDAQSFLIKSARGSASNVSRNMEIRYWRRFQRGGEEVRLLAARAPALQAEMATLNAASDGRLMGMRRRALRKWILRVAELLATPEGAALYDAVRAVPPQPLTNRATLRAEQG